MTDKEFIALSQCVLFKNLSTAALTALTERKGVSVLTYKARQTVYSPKNFTRSIGVLLSGTAAVEKHAGSASMLMSVLRPGDVFGAATVLSDSEVYPVSIRALGDVTALIIPEKTFISAMQEDFTLAEQYMRYLTGRIRFLSSRIDGFVQPSAEERLYTFLRANAVNGRVKLGVPVKALADALCIGRATLYRAFDTLENQGRIRRDGRLIELLEGEKEL